MAVVQSFELNLASRVALVDLRTDGGLQVHARALLPYGDGEHEQAFQDALCSYDGAWDDVVFDGQMLIQMPIQPTPAHVWGWATMSWVATPSQLNDYISELRAAALQEIDTRAERARLRYITGGAGQDAVYTRKEAQARAWQAASFAGPAPSFIAAEAARKGKQPQAIALLIIQLADYWANVKGPEIEAERTYRKDTVVAAADADSIVGAREAALSALDLL